MIKRITTCESNVFQNDGIYYDAIYVVYVQERELRLIKRPSFKIFVLTYGLVYVLK